MDSAIGVLALARENMLTYQSVFLQVQSNSHKTMTAGYCLAFAMLDAKVGMRDFSKPTALEPAFMNVHEPKIEEAHTELRANKRGIFVEMALNWGNAQAGTLQPRSGRTEAITSRPHRRTQGTERLHEHGFHCSPVQHAQSICRLRNRIVSYTNGNSKQSSTGHAAPFVTHD